MNVKAPPFFLRLNVSTTARLGQLAGSLLRDNQR